MIALSSIARHNRIPLVTASHFTIGCPLPDNRPIWYLCRASVVTAAYPIFQQFYFDTAFKTWPITPTTRYAHYSNRSDSQLTVVNLQLMTLDYTLHHHAANINAVALNPDGDRLISGGKLEINYLFIQPFIIIQVTTLTLSYGTLWRVRRYRLSPVRSMVPLEHSFGFPKGLGCHQALPSVVLMAVSTYISGQDHQYVITWYSDNNTLILLVFSLIINTSHKNSCTMVQ